MRGSQRPNDQKSLKDPQAKLQKPKFAASSYFPIQLGYDHKWVVYPRVSNKPKFPQIIYTVLVLSLYHVISCYIILYHVISPHFQTPTVQTNWPWPSLAINLAEPSSNFEIECDKSCRRALGTYGTSPIIEFMGLVCR